MPEALTNDNQNRAKLILNVNSVSTNSVTWSVTVTDGNASYGGYGFSGATLTLNVNGGNVLNEANKSYDFGGTTGSNTIVSNAFFPKSGKTFSNTTSGLAAGSTYNINATFSTTGNVGSATVSFSFTTSSPPPAATPVWQTGTFLAPGRRGFFYSATVTASPATSYSLVTSSGAGGLSLSGNTISGTPTTVGTASITIRANNSGSTADKVFNIEIKNSLGRRQTSSGFENINAGRRFNGTAWIPITVSKRFNGTSWVDILN
jgi:hypothetical protein